MKDFLCYSNYLSKAYLSLLLLILTVSCGGSNDQSGSKLKHVGDPYEVPNVWRICNNERYDLYLTLAHTDYSGKYFSVGQDPYTGAEVEAANSEVHSWIKLPSSVCTDVGPMWKVGLILLRSTEGPYEVRGNGTATAEAGSAVCVNRILSDSATIAWTAITGGYSFMKPYMGCPSGTTMKDRLIYADLPNRDCSLSTRTTINCKFSLIGGEVRPDGDAFTLGGQFNDESKKLDSKIQQAQADLERAERELGQCDVKVAHIKSKKVLEIDTITFGSLADSCGESDRIKSLADQIKSIQEEVRAHILGICQSLEDAFKAVLSIAGKLQVTQPLDDEYQQVGISDFVYSSTKLAVGSAKFYSTLFTSYQGFFDSSYTADKKKFLVSVMGLTSTMVALGRLDAQNSPLNQDRYLDFRGAAAQAEDYFGKVDFDKDEYGYPLTSEIPEDIKNTIRDDIKPNAPMQGQALEDELKKWEGTLNDKQRLVLEAVRFLGKAFHKSLLELPEELSTVNARLRSITEGAVEAVKDVTKCFIKVGVVGDFADWYETINKKDFCTGEEITFSGQVLSAVGLVAGSSKFWRVMGETVGIAVSTKRVFKGTEEFIDSAKKWDSIDSLVHIVKGEYKVATDGTTQLISGMHTNFGFDNFLKLNQSAGKTYNIRNATEFTAERIESGGAILSQTLDNGVRRIQLPRDAWANNSAFSGANFPISDSLRLKGVKTLWPESYDVSKIGDVTTRIVEANPSVRNDVIKATVDGVTINVRVDSAGKVLTSYPAWNQ